MGAAAVGEVLPKVSVIIPVFEASDFLRETLESVFAQTYRDYELIVVNDGCPEPLKLRSLLEPYRSRLILIEQSNRGLSAARNAGIRNSRGEFLAFLDSDDLWHPQFLQRQIEFLEARPELDMVWSDSVYFGETAHAGRRFSAVNPVRLPVTLERLLREETVPITSCVVLRRRVLLQAGLFDENLRRAEDFDLWLRLARLGVRMDYQNLVLGWRRMRGDSLSADRAAQFDAVIAVLEKFRGSLPPESPLREVVEARIRVNRSLRALNEARAAMDSWEHQTALAAYRQSVAESWSFQSFLMILLLRFAPRLTSRIRSWRRVLLKRGRFTGPWRRFAQQHGPSPSASLPPSASAGKH